MAPTLTSGQVIMLLNGVGAGSEFTVETDIRMPWPHHYAKARRTAKPYERGIGESDLFAILPDLTAPEWLPPLDLRNGFIIDELATWFCSRGLVGGGFYWRLDDIIELVRVCWLKRLPVTATEVSLVLTAHGMPDDRQEPLERMFSFGMECLVQACRRPPMKKFRMPQAIAEAFSEALRYYR